MTQEDLQRDVKWLESIRQITHCADYDEQAEALDRAIETARVLASLTDSQRGALFEHCERMATSLESSPFRDDEHGTRADAHRKVARLIGGDR